MFPGFFRPRSNCYRLPNDWFDIWANVRQETGRTRILGLLKVTEYTIKWTWGDRNFDEPVRISRRAFQYGRQQGSRRLDRGTGLGSRCLEESLRSAEQIGLLEQHADGNGGPTFLPHLRPPTDDEAGFPLDEAEAVSRQGFERPTANYFLVPGLWTDLTAGISSEILILTVEYCFRHQWGWQAGWDEPCWLTDEEVAHGRRYRSKERQGQRYDNGIGYSVERVRDALNEAVARGWAVWRNEDGHKQYALHLKGMTVAEDGEFLGFEQSEEEAERASSKPAPRATPPSPAGDDELARLKAQVADLTAKVEVLQALLQNTDATTATGDERKAPQDERKALQDERKAPTGRKESAYYTDTSPDTSPTPPPDTAALDAGGCDGGGVGEDGVLLERLTALTPPMSREAAARLIADYGTQPVQAWLDVLAGDPTVRSVAALLTHKLRAGETPPANGHDPRVEADCPLCRGSGVIRPDVPAADPDHGKALPCPRCRAKAAGAQLA